jgi:hypothetical protein
VHREGTDSIMASESAGQPRSVLELMSRRRGQSTRQGTCHRLEVSEAQLIFFVVAGSREECGGVSAEGCSGSHDMKR